MNTALFFPDEAAAMMRTKGEVRGAALIPNLAYIREHEGEEGIRKLEKKMEEMGYPFSLDAIENASYYPLGYGILLIELISRLFGYGEERMEEMGRYGVRTSRVLRLFTRYLLAPRATLAQASRIWERHFTRGSLEILDLDEKRKKARVRVSDFPMPTRAWCANFQGYLAGVWVLVSGVQARSVREKKGEGAEHGVHEFEIIW